MRIIELQTDFGDFLLDIRDKQFQCGLTHGLIGPNGCGKTTFAKLIMGTVPARCKNINYEGLTARDMTMTTQKPYMMYDTVYNNLVYPLKLRGITPGKAEVDRWLSLCGLEEKRNKPARGLSSGQQQKLSLARALIFCPKLVIIDENLSNLDLDSIELFEAEIMRIQKAAPITWIIISHQPAHVRRLCDVVHFMDKGRILKSGSPADLLTAPTEAELVRFISREALHL